MQPIVYIFLYILAERTINYLSASTIGGMNSDVVASRARDDSPSSTLSLGSSQPFVQSKLMLWRNYWEPLPLDLVQCRGCQSFRWLHVDVLGRHDVDVVVEVRRLVELMIFSGSNWHASKNCSALHFAAFSLFKSDFT